VDRNIRTNNDLLVQNLTQTENAVLEAARRPGASADLLARAAAVQAGRDYFRSYRLVQAQ
jgi:hypothetical protein